MRAVDRTPWADHRSSKHDEMCAIVASHPEKIFPGYAGLTRVTVEKELGRGFADVFAIKDAPPGEVEVAILEIKTRYEDTSAGDVIRQLKWYRAQLTPELQLVTRLAVVVEDDSGLPGATMILLANEGIEVLPIGWFTMGETTA